MTQALQASKPRSNRALSNISTFMIRENRDEGSYYGKSSREKSNSPKLLYRVKIALRSRHYSRRTEKTYVSWIKRFIYFNDIRHLVDMGEKEINAFLTYLAVKRNVSSSTQNHALSALLFLYRHVLMRDVGDLGDIIRARKPKRLPVVLTSQEVRRVFNHLKGTKLLMAGLMYGSGLRLTECLRLRVQDIDFARA